MANKPFCEIKLKTIKRNTVLLEEDKQDGASHTEMPL